MTRTSLGDVLNEAIKDSTKFPYFLNKRNKEDKITFTIISDCILHISELIKPIFESDKKINMHLLKYLDLLMGFEENVTKLETYFACYTYLSRLINKYKLMAIENELYEVVQNLEKFEQFGVNTKNNYGL